MSSRRWVYDWVRTPSLPHLWVNMGSKNRFFHKSLKVIFLSSLTISDDSGVQIWCLKIISDLKKMRFSTFSKIEILGPNPSEMMTLRLQILKFSLLLEFYLNHFFIILHGAKHSFPFLTLSLSWGRGNMAPEAFDVLGCKWVMVPACTHNPGNHLKFRALDIESYLRSLSHLDMSFGWWV